MLRSETRGKSPRSDALPRCSAGPPHTAHAGTGAGRRRGRPSVRGGPWSSSSSEVPRRRGDGAHSRGGRTEQCGIGEPTGPVGVLQPGTFSKGVQEGRATSESSREGGVSPAGGRPTPGSDRPERATSGTSATRRRRPPEKRASTSYRSLVRSSRPLQLLDPAAVNAYTSPPSGGMDPHRSRRSPVSATAQLFECGSRVRA